MSYSTKLIEPFFAGSGGIVAPVDNNRDPLELLDELMVVVEALCPAWPQRKTFENAESMRL